MLHNMTSSTANDTGDEDVSGCEPPVHLRTPFISEQVYQIVYLPAIRSHSVESKGKTILLETLGALNTSLPAGYSHLLGVLCRATQSNPIRSIHLELGRSTQ